MDAQQQSQAALSSTPQGVVQPSGAVPSTAAAQLALTGDNLQATLVRLTASLRAGLAGPRLRDAGLTLQVPAGVDPFDFFGGAADGTEQRTEDLPKEALSAESLGSSRASGPDMADRMVALMTQDMATFGVVGRESVRLATPHDGYRLDYFA